MRTAKRAASQDRYDRSEKGRARQRRWIAQHRAAAKAQGLCTTCMRREADFGATSCERCRRYQAEYKWLGYSSIPLAKGSDG